MGVHQREHICDHDVEMYVGATGAGVYSGLSLVKCLVCCLSGNSLLTGVLELGACPIPSTLQPGLVVPIAMMQSPSGLNSGSLATFVS